MPVLKCFAFVCGKYYQLNTFDLSSIDQGGSGEVLCPHCGGRSGMLAQLPFITHALSADQERRQQAPVH
jgi:hypothetical protein